MTEKDLIRLCHEVMSFDAKKHARADRWTLRYSFKHRGGRTGTVAYQGKTTADLRAMLRDAATRDAAHWAERVRWSRESLDEMRERHAQELARQEREIADREAEAAERRALLEEVERALAEP